MPFDENTFNTAVSTSVANSFNDTETNTLGIDVGVANSFNETKTVENADNTNVDITGSFHEDSYNQEWDVEDSNNTDSYNDTYNLTDSSTHDHSINAGVREYSTGFGDLSFAGAAGAAAASGEVLINNQNTIVDQSVNGNIAAFGPVHQVVSSESVVASGTDSMAAGDDVNVDTYVNTSTNIEADGDVLIDGSTKTVTQTIDSGNTYNFEHNETETDIDVDIDDSWNTATFDTTVTDSFTDESLVFTDVDVDADVDAILGSNGAAIVDDIDIDL